jgi:hypothetical protein
MPNFLPQTVFTRDPLPGYLGQPFSLGRDTHQKGAMVALDVIQPGDLLERLFDSTSNTYCVRPAQAATGALVSLAGVAVYKTIRSSYEPPYNTTYVPGYQIGDMVEFVRKGKIYAKWYSAASAAQVAFSAPNYAHSSTTVGTGQGAFTDHAVATTTGAEVDVLPVNSAVLDPDQTGIFGFTTVGGLVTSVCLVELNFNF